MGTTAWHRTQGDLLGEDGVQAGRHAEEPPEQKAERA
jgi:hypothetical protein